ncbi:DELLA protein RGL1-like [Lotus japonicus]|uniref:DELLA protein RGL1-like n=1 Tax=Lotus japonicus TaxID=34305 RepID=UPI002585F673|nr:DELLA protein RGL1-like [Lotus japonicus]
MEEYYHFMELSPSAVEDKFSSSNDILWATDVGLNEMKKVQFSAECGGIDSPCLDYGFLSNDPSEEEARFLLSTDQPKDHQQPSYEPWDNLRFDMVSSPLQIQVEDIMQIDENFSTKVPLFYPAKNKQFPTPLAPIEILKHYGKGFKRLCDEGKILHPLDDSSAVITNVDGRKLSTEDVMRVAGTKFIHSASESPGLDLLVTHPFGFSFSELSIEEKEDAELAESLLSCAEKIGYQQYERASKLLSHCKSLTSNRGGPVKRVVHYFAEALQHMIDKETGRVSIKEMQEIQKHDPEELTKDLNPITLLFYERLPFCQISMFTGVQAIIENVTEAKKIHLIDLEIRKGAQWTTLMHALESRHDCPLELLKITAIGSGTTSRHEIEDTGEKLKVFAKSLNIPFSFNVVIVSDMVDIITEDVFVIDPEETVAVYSQFAIRCKIQEPNQLEAIMRMVRTLKPVVMVVAEIEANHNSTSFVKRFTEALFYFSAFFDCLEACMKHDEQNRIMIETLLGHGIRSIVAERKSRNVKIDVWRAYFSRFGMEETELSRVSLYQADLVAKRFPSGSCCTFHMDGHCLLVGWKGTPISSVSVWKFT